MKALAIVAALALSGAASAQHVAYDPGYAWFVGPAAATGDEGRARIVTLPGHGRAALTVNQYYEWQRTYRLSLGRFGMRMPFAQAEPRARHAAWHAVIGDGPVVRVEDLALAPLSPGALPLFSVD